MCRVVIIERLNPTDIFDDVRLTVEEAIEYLSYYPSDRYISIIIQE